MRATCSSTCRYANHRALTLDWSGIWLTRRLHLQVYGQTTALPFPDDGVSFLVGMVESVTGPVRFLARILS